MSALNETSLNRLRWSVFDDPSEIRVINDASEISSTIRSFEGHPIASELVTNPPLKQMNVSSNTLEHFAVIERSIEKEAGEEEGDSNSSEDSPELHNIERYQGRMEVISPSGISF